MTKIQALELFWLCSVPAFTTSNFHPFLKWKVDINYPQIANEQPLSPMGGTIQLYTPQLATVQELYVQKNIYPISDLVLLPHTSHYIRPSLEWWCFILLQKSSSQILG